MGRHSDLDKAVRIKSLAELKWNTIIKCGGMCGTGELPEEIRKFPAQCSFCKYLAAYGNCRTCPLHGKSGNQACCIEFKKWIAAHSRDKMVAAAERMLERIQSIELSTIVQAIKAVRKEKRNG